MTARGVTGTIVALTGTPGTGKSSVAAGLRGLGYLVLDLKRYVGDPRFDLGEDPARPGARILDEGLLSEHLHERLAVELGIAVGDARPVFIDSHFAHELDIVDRILVLRCRPSLLRERLVPRGWSEAKVRENLEAEALDLVLQEALAVRDDAAELGVTVPVGEVDTSGLSPEAVVARILALAVAPPSSLEIGTVDWSGEVLGWF